MQSSGLSIYWEATWLASGMNAHWEAILLTSCDAWAREAAPLVPGEIYAWDATSSAFAFIAGSSRLPLQPLS